MLQNSRSQTAVWNCCKHSRKWRQCTLRISSVRFTAFDLYRVEYDATLDILQLKQLWNLPRERVKSMNGKQGGTTE